MAKNNAKNLMRGALLLSVASLIAKILSAVYRVPFQNIVGNTGFYVYQQVYPIYGIGMTLALSGLPNFISKLVAEQESMGARKQILRASFWIVGVFSLLIFLGLFLNATAIANLMGDGGLVALIQVVAFMFLLTPILSCLRGYFQGTFEMRPTAISQVVEQLLRVGIILLAAGLYVHFNWGDYQMGAVAMSGALVGGLAAALVMIPRYRRDPLAQVAPSQTPLNWGHLIKRFWVEGGAISLFAATMVIMQLVDSFTVTKGLMHSGSGTTVAFDLKGVYDRAQPLVQMGLVVTMAFVTALLPALSAARLNDKPVLFMKLTQQLTHIALALSAAATVGLMALMPWINRLLFGDSQGSLTIAIYMISVILVALINVFSSVLQSLDRFKIPTLALILGFVVKLLINQKLTEALGIAGSALATVLALGVVALLIFLCTPAYVKHAVFARGFIWKLLLIVVVMGFIVLSGAVGMQSLLALSRSSAVVITLVNMLVGLLVFGILCVAFKLLTFKEWLSLPLVGKMLRRWLNYRAHLKGRK